MTILRYITIVSLFLSAPAFAAQPTNWANVVQRSRDGGYIVGNPNAKVKVVEYGSLTCIYCAVFANTDYKIMVARYVTKGSTNFEFRYMSRDRVDSAAGLLMRCVPTSRYFDVLNHLFAQQKSWFNNSRAKVAKLNLTGKTDGQRYQLVVSATGLDRIFRDYGLSDIRQKNCLNDKGGMAALNRVADIGSNTYDISGTPSFLINNKLVDGNDWAAVERGIKKAGG